MPRATRLVGLITDFGTSDTYVGQMKAAILGRCPGARIVDVTHDVPRGDVLAGAFALLEAFGAFPRGSVHVCVVDPGVGTDQARLAVRAGGSFFVAPDNGLLSPMLERLGRAEARRLSTAGASSTFHGRDVFAPAAAHLAAGKSFARLGPRAARIAGLDWPRPERSQRQVRAEVIHVDRFGNLVTNLRPEDLPSGDLVFGIRRRVLRGLSTTYGEVSRGELLALIGSHGMVEIAAREDSAARRLKARRGARVTVTRG
jgi:S-adenosylmethionine hydrolase